MKLVRSDSPEVARGLACADIRAARYFSAFFYGLPLNAAILLISIAVSLLVSVRAAAYFGGSALIAWNVYVLWLLKLSSRHWVIAACADRVYVRLFMARGSEPQVIVFETSEIASMSIKIVEAFVHGPEPQLAEWLVIEPAQTFAEVVPSDSLSFLESIWMHDSGNVMRVGILEGRLTIGWRYCEPALRTFLQQVVGECPSIVVAPEEHSELDLNSIWQHGIREEPNASDLRMLVQAKRLGFGGECVQRLSQYRHMSLREASAYLATAERAEAAAGRGRWAQNDYTMHYPHL